MSRPRPPSVAPLASALGLAAALGLGCAPIPPPDVLRELDQIRAAPAVVEARRDAPTAVDHAELLRLEAQVALEQGDFAAAQLVAERARTAYQVAVALARVARAEQSKVSVEAELGEAAKQLDQTDSDHQRVAADIAALEVRLGALRQVAAAGGAASSGGGERASSEAVAAFRLQARLLCTAARLLWLERRASPEAVGPQAELARLEPELGAEPGERSIEQAVALRAACLGQLTRARRAADVRVAAGGADALLDELSAVGVGVPARDERGVVLTVREVFDGSALGKGVAERLAPVGEVARKHPEIPLLLVLHQSTAPAPADRERWLERGRALGRALGREGAIVELAGTAEPVVDPAGSHRARNERAEIVFVTPGAL
jgi:hypothetical protein